MTQEFHANGKILFTSEYVVLDGAKALVLPTKSGQKLSVNSFKNSIASTLKWEAIFMNGSPWFEVIFSLPELKITHTNDLQKAKTLENLLHCIQFKKPDFFSNLGDTICKTNLEFESHWGLGSSSTLISLLAQWTDVDPYYLLENSFKTSGFDVAAANLNCPFSYQIIQKNQREISSISFNPPFIDQLYFVYLNKKQDTFSGVKSAYQSKPKNQELIDKITEIANSILSCQTLEAFENLIELHENLISQHIEMPKAKTLYFNDYTGAVKSLGAWGGDFVLMTYREGIYDYLSEKGFLTIKPFHELVF